MIILHLILYSAVHIYDFYLFITLTNTLFNCQNHILFDDTIAQFCHLMLLSFYQKVTVKVSYLFGLVDLKKPGVNSSNCWNTRFCGKEYLSED